MTGPLSRVGVIEAHGVGTNKYIRLSPMMLYGTTRRDCCRRTNVSTPIDPKRNIRAGVILTLRKRFHHCSAALSLRELPIPSPCCEHFPRSSLALPPLADA